MYNILDQYHQLFEVKEEKSIESVYNMKSGVDIVRLDKSINEVLSDIIQTIVAVNGNKYTPTITSGVDSIHSLNSRHYWGHAIDIRTNDMKISQSQKRDMAKKIQQKLGNKYYVLYEEPGRAGSSAEHLHIQTSKQLVDLANVPRKMEFPKNKKPIPEQAEIIYAAEYPDDTLAREAIPEEDLKKANTPLPSDQLEKFEENMGVISEVGKTNKFDPYLLSSLISDRSSFDFSKKTQNQYGPLMIPRQTIQKYNTDVSDKKSMLYSGIQYIKDLTNAYNDPKMGLIALYVDPSKLNDVLVELDMEYAKSNNKDMTRTGIYKNEKRDDLPEISPYRKNLSLIYRQLDNNGIDSNEVKSKISYVMDLASKLKSSIGKQT